DEMNLPDDVIRVREDPPLSGPAAAIAAGVTALEDNGTDDTEDNDLVLLLAADLVNPGAAVTALLEKTDGKGAVATVDGRLQPLLSVARLGTLREAIGEDALENAPVMRLLRRLDLPQVELSTTAAADVDTWEDWMEAVRHIPVTWDDARDSIVAAVPRCTASDTKPPEPGDVLAADLPSPMDVPHYTSSAMDGFAVNGEGPWRLLAEPTRDAQGRNVHRTGGTLAPGEALPVLTGSLIPDGTTAVVRSENAVVDSGTLTADTPVPGRDIRPAGQEWSAGEVLVRAGVRLTARHVAMLGACGVDEVEVTRKPRVACAFTGNEVIGNGIPEPGEVRDAFSASFPALLGDWGADTIATDRLPDDPVAVEDWLRRPDVRGADIVVLTGGSGRSGQDFARRFITRAADEILADEVACQPGHPTLITRRGRGEDTQLVIGVPGNPFAAHVSLHSFVAPAVTSRLGLASPTATGTGVVTADVDPIQRDRVRLVPATRDSDSTSNGGDRFTPAPGAHSHMLSGYAAADVLLVVPQDGLAAGDALTTAVTRYRPR
ncbi:MAG: molybdopterin-binding protein, partial [Mycobacteriaceae bacterium]